MKPELSVIIPVYNTEKYLNRCLDSVFRQSLRQIEVIVVDDCSPGDTEAVLAPYLEAYANLKYFRHEKNKGLYLARHWQRGIISHSLTVMIMSPEIFIGHCSGKPGTQGPIL